jgi:hypothetical protein
MPPGCTVTKAAAIVFRDFEVVAIGDPHLAALVWRVGFIEAREKVNG